MRSKYSNELGVYSSKTIRKDEIKENTSDDD